MMVYAIWATLLVISASGIAMSGPPPADPNAVSGERGEGGAGGNGEAGEEEGEENEHERADLTVGSFLIAPAFADEGGEKGEGAGEGEELFEEMHEIAVNLLYVLIALHLAGVVFETRRSGREVVGSMIPGGNRRN